MLLITNHKNPLTKKVYHPNKKYQQKIIKYLKIIIFN
jgi:hypothetical protein